ncbi:MAG TPA: polysaccharide deacetylase family protein, partial [Fimbriimonas sp.]|nr:polysaccharide deacetylase family protein [Fimbriimonas sp.]
MESRPVFYDPKGRRGTFVTRVGTFVASLAAVVSTATLLFTFFRSLYLPIVLPQSKPTALPGMPGRDQKLPSFFTSADRKKITQDIARDISRRRNTPLVKATTVAAGFYAPWEASGLASLRLNAGHLTHVLPQWLHLTQDGEGIDAATDFDPNHIVANRDVMGIARKNGLSILPILDNFALGYPDKVRLQKMLDSPKAQEAVASSLNSFLREWEFQGVNLDFELVGSKQATEFVQFLKLLRQKFDQGKTKLTLTVDIEAENTLPLADVSEQCDWLVLMAYDEHSEDDVQGPIASIAWSENLVEKVLATVPNNKLVLGIGNYAYDWVDGKAGADNQTFQEAISNAAGYRSETPSQVIRYDDNSLNNTFAYRDDDDQRHVVWMLDAVSAYNQWKAARENQIRGAALWYLGAEDPTTWSFFDRRGLNGPMDLRGLETVHFPYEISFTGRGEILTIKDYPRDGKRSVKLEQPQPNLDNRLIGTCAYDSYATPYVIRKSGYLPKKLALTFDDGPDPTWTPQILQVLKETKTPATFFVIGNSCESHPGLVGQEYADGHEIGSHSYFHPNMGAISEGRDRLELNLTQLAIEMATGRSTILFRPPYNADSEPETEEQLRPIRISAQMGYVTVAENVDPLDWDLKQPDGNGGFRKKTGDDIVRAIDVDLKTRSRNQDEGNMVLLHDAGGDRSATVDALRKMIPLLRSEGYEFVSVSTLMHKTRDQVMPPVQDKDKVIFWLGKITLGTTYAVLWFLSIAFIAAIGLGLLRISVVTALALFFRRGEHVPVVPSFQPSVSVLIAAFNEEAVIRRTIESVLNSDYPISEIIVIDDGSSDETSAAVTEAFHDEPRVRLLQQENGGKASALNNGIEHSQGTILFCIDAD